MDGLQETIVAATTGSTTSSNIIIFHRPRNQFYIGLGSPRKHRMVNYQGVLQWSLLGVMVIGGVFNVALRGMAERAYLSERDARACLHR